MVTEVTVKLNIILSTEQFKGPDHTGEQFKEYKIDHPIIIFNQGNKLVWRQGRSEAQRIEAKDRLPGNGITEINRNGDCLLKDNQGTPVVNLMGFTTPVTSQKGIAEYKYQNKEYTPQKNSTLTWVGRGTWEVVQDRSDPPSPRYLTSAWKYNTSASAALGILFIEGGSGTLVFTDPSKVDRKFAYVGGGPSVDAGKVLKLIKALKDLVWVGKVAKGTGMIKAGGSVASEDMFSTGVILKNVLSTGTRELTKEDFLGFCVWIDGSIGIYKSLGGMILLTNVHTVGPFPTFSACIPCGGVNTTLIAAGVGACIGWISPG